MTKIGIALLVISLSYMIGQTYEMFNGSSLMVDPFLLVDNPMKISWAVKFFTEELNRVLEAIAFFVITIKFRDIMSRFSIKPIEEKYLKTIFIVSRVYLIYRILDLAIWFVSFKRDYYWTVFVIVGAIEIYLYRKNKIKHNEIYFIK